MTEANQIAALDLGEELDGLEDLIREVEQRGVFSMASTAPAALGKLVNVMKLMHYRIKDLEALAADLIDDMAEAAGDIEGEGA